MNKVFKFFKKGEQGFTLIELLVVVAILGVLAAVAVPNLASMMKAGDIAVAKAEAASVQTAVDAAITVASPALTTAQITALTQSSPAVAAFLRGAVKGTYTVAADGSITGTGGWGSFTWDTPANTWKK